MKPLLRTALWVGGVTTLLVAAALSLFIAWVLTEGLPPGSVITVDGERLVMPELTRAVHWLLLAIGVLIVSTLIACAVPVVLVFGIGVPLAAGALSIALSLLTAALLVLPLVLLARWLWRGLTKRETPTQPTQPTTITT